MGVFFEEISSHFLLNDKCGFNSRGVSSQIEDVELDIFAQHIHNTVV